MTLKKKKTPKLRRNKKRKTRLGKTTAHARDRAWQAQSATVAVVRPTVAEPARLLYTHYVQRSTSQMVVGR